MKEVTEWDNNPRMMWVWDDHPSRMIKAKVIWITHSNRDYPVVILTDKENIEIYMHCAEIEDGDKEPKLMTNMQLAHWLRQGSNRFCRTTYLDIVTYLWTFSLGEEDKEVKHVLVREGDGEWKEPTADLWEQSKK